MGSEGSGDGYGVTWSNSRCSCDTLDERPWYAVKGRTKYINGLWTFMSLCSFPNKARYSQTCICVRE